MKRNKSIVTCAWIFAAAAATMTLGASSCVQEEGVSQKPRGQRSLPVVRGELADITEFPSTVAVMMRYFGAWITGCTGTLIAPNVVMTAAHCLHEDGFGAPIPASQLRVVYGYNEPAEAHLADLHKIESITPHPDFANKCVPIAPYGMCELNDIGILVLSEAIPDGKTVPILPRSLISTVLVAGSEAGPATLMDIVGYGIHDESDPLAFGILYKAQTPYTDRIEWEFVAGNDNSPDTCNTCNGDSGGPVYVNYDSVRYVVGVTSRASDKTTGDSACGGIGIYTLASSYTDWIQSVIDNISDGGPPDVKPDVETDVEVDVEPDVESDVEVDVEPDVETDVEVDVKPDVETDVEVDVEPDVETDVEVDVQPDVESDVEVDVQSDVETDVEVDVQPDVESDAVEADAQELDSAPDAKDDAADGAVADRGVSDSKDTEADSTIDGLEANGEDVDESAVEGGGCSCRTTTGTTSHGDVLLLGLVAGAVSLLRRRRAGR